MRFFHAPSIGVGVKDGLQRDTVRAKGKGLVEFALVLGGDAKFEPGRADGADVGVFEIRLPQMDKIAAKFDGQPPMVVDDELRTKGGAKVAGADNLMAQIRLWPVLDPQLDQSYAAGKHALAPVGAVDDDIKRIKLQATSIPAAAQCFQVIKAAQSAHIVLAETPARRKKEAQRNKSPFHGGSHHFPQHFRR